MVLYMNYSFVHNTWFQIKELQFPKNSKKVVISNLDCVNSEELLDVCYKTFFNDNLAVSCIQLINCNVLESIDKILLFFPNVISLYIENLPKLKYIINDISSLKNLEQLVINDCWSLSDLPNGFRNLRAFRIFKLSGSDNIRRIDLNLRYNQVLDLISIEFCNKLRKITIDSCNELTIKNCLRLRKIVSKTTKIKQLKIISCPLMVRLPIIKENSALEILIIKNCFSLRKITNNIKKCENINEIDIKNCNKLKTMPKKLNFDKLITFRIEKCPNLISKMELYSPTLNELVLSRTSLSLKLHETYNIKKLKVNCIDGEKIPDIRKMNKLSILKIKACNFQSKYFLSISNEENLDELILDSCNDLVINLRDLVLHMNHISIINCKRIQFICDNNLLQKYLENGHLFIDNSFYTIRWDIGNELYK